MAILGLILLILGWIFHIGFLVWIGGILLVIGLILFLLHSTGNGLGGRHYW